MLKKLFNVLRKLKRNSKAKENERNDAVVLKIIKKGKTIAYLSTEDDGKVFTLTYTSEFPESGVPPFNMKLSDRGKIEARKIYKSDVLWYAFAARVPSPKRPDFWPAMKRAGLTGNEPVLEIIGKVSRTSISRSWILEIDEAA